MKSYKLFNNMGLVFLFTGYLALQLVWWSALLSGNAQTCVTINASGEAGLELWLNLFMFPFVVFAFTRGLRK